MVIVDAAPAGSVQAADSGTVFFVGEYEDGGFATDPVQAADVYHPPGGPIAVGRDQWSGLVGTLGYTVNGLKNQYPCCRLSNGEFWNGNAYVQAKGLAFKKFYAVRVDLSVGSLVFSPLAFLESSAAGPWSLTTGQTLVFSINGGADGTATFTGTAATITGGIGTPATVVSGEYFDISIDGAATVRTTFQTGDTTFALIAARINAAFGSPIAAVPSNLSLTSGTGGTSSKVNIVGGSTGLVAKLGHVVGVTTGGGNVANIAAVTFAEVKTVVEATASGGLFPFIRQTATSKVRIASRVGTTGTIRVQAASTATAFGFTTATTKSATSGILSSTIPAGTPCTAAGAAASRVVTMQTLTIPANTAVAVTVKCRPALDDGSFLQQSATTMDTIDVVISPIAEWVVSNPVLLTAALTETQKDAAYQAAFDVTRAISGPSRTANYIGSARQSIRGRAATLENAKQTSSLAHWGRKARLSPPIGSSLATMVAAAEPGVANYRHERACYSPGWRKFISEIGAIGSTAGGTGFTDDGVVQTHGDIVLLSLDSLLNPEENSAQATDLIPRSLYVGVESSIANWTIDDYIAAKAAGICAPFMHETEGPQYMSYVTTVDPNSLPSQVPAQRVKLADNLTDSVAEFQGPFVKKLRTDARRTALLTKLQEFLQSYLDDERIAGFTAEEGPRVRRAHVLDWKVEPLDSMDVIVNRTSIGEGALEVPNTTRQGA